MQKHKTNFGELLASYRDAVHWLAEEMKEGGETGLPSDLLEAFVEGTATMEQVAAVEAAMRDNPLALKQVADGLKALPVPPTVAELLYYKLGLLDRDDAARVEYWAGRPQSVEKQWLDSRLLASIAWLVEQGAPLADWLGRLAGADPLFQKPLAWAPAVGFADHHKPLFRHQEDLNGLLVEIAEQAGGELVVAARTNDPELACRRLTVFLTRSGDAEPVAVDLELEAVDDGADGAAAYGLISDLPRPPQTGNLDPTLECSIILHDDTSASSCG